MNSGVMSSMPDAAGHYDIFGGRFVPEALVAALDQLEAEFDKAMGDKTFWRELDGLRRDRGCVRLIRG